MLSSIFRNILQHLSFFYKNDMSNAKKKDKRIYKKLSHYQIKNLKNIENLKSTHDKFNKQIYLILKKGRLYNFLRNSFIQKMFFVHNRFFIYNELRTLKKNQNWNFYKKLLIEDNIGNPIRYFLYPKSSGNRINHVYHLSLLEKLLEIKLKNINYIFEFGGGYGCMARIFFKINKKVRYSIFDTPLVNLLQFYYLKQNSMNVGFNKNSQFVLNNELTNIKSIKSINSLFIANWSLSETPIFYRNKFLKYIQNHHYILIAFQEYFEEINNREYFYKLKKILSKNYEITIFENKFYKGNIFKKQKHYFFVGKKIKNDF